MSYNVPFRPQLYTYQSRGRTRQYPQRVRTSIPGAGFDVRKLVWGDQPIDLSVGGLGTMPASSTLYWGLGAAALIGGSYLMLCKKRKAA